jgi:hypothetical protein
MKKIFTIIIVLTSTVCYGQVGVRSGSSFTVFTTAQSNSKFAPMAIVTTVNSLVTQNAAFSTQIATMQTAIVNLNSSVNTLKVDVADLKTKNTALTLVTVNQQKTIDSINRGVFIRYPVVWLKGKNGAIDTLTTVKP